VAQGKSSRVVLTRRNRPVAALVPYQQKLTPLWGAMKGSVVIAAGTDLTEPTGEIWEADV
jgi:antitoxin (DNA-binding transcriptional repressor) of toxin-antitoxin stability system